jgi:Flp pilus assembly protein protease CpaA
MPNSNFAGLLFWTAPLLSIPIEAFVTQTHSPIPLSTMVVVLVLGVISTWNDIARRVIPNEVVYSSSLAALSLLWLQHGGSISTLPQGSVLLPSLLGALACTAVMMLGWVTHQIGAGDIKLCAVIGLLFGVQDGISIILIANLTAAAYVAVAFGYRFCKTAVSSDIAGSAIIRPLEEDGLPMAGFYSIGMLIVMTWYAVN